MRGLLVVGKGCVSSASFGGFYASNVYNHAHTMECI
jgi:hypothetical protein